MSNSDLLSVLQSSKKEEKRGGEFHKLESVFYESCGGPILAREEK